MSICSNCYSNCAEIQSDKCVKYTGVDIAVLGIQNGDSMNYVTAAIAGFLTSTLDATGIKYELEAENMCALIEAELVDCTDITQRAISNALASVICAIDTRVVTLEAFKTSLDSGYTPGCVPGITGASGTKVVLQAVIDYLCTVSGDLDALELEVSTNYVLVSDINTYIADYLASLSVSSANQRDKMIPYTVVEYYGPVNVFDASGAGLNEWEQVYLCNGQNGTPDKRGRIAIGATSGMNGGTFPAATDPGISGNPSYNLLTPGGSNTVTLTSAQMPSHSHTTSVTSDGEHVHVFPATLYTKEGASGDDNTFSNTNNTGKVDVTQTLSAGTHTHTVAINATGGGGSHSNVPPVLACYYIMYIPTV